jgi:hypothetical protein
MRWARGMYGIAAGVLLAAAEGAAARAAVSGEAVPPAETATPPAEGETSLPRVLRKASRRTVLWATSRTLQPLFGFCRGPLKRLLPSSRYLPSHLARREHDDYMIPGLAQMPRAWTTFDWGEPRLILGNQKHKLNGAPKPIGERGSFQLSLYPNLPPPFCWIPAYFAFTLSNGVHFRLGARWDDVDDYTVVPSVAVKFKVE